MLLVEDLPIPSRVGFLLSDFSSHLLNIIDLSSLESSKVINGKAITCSKMGRGSVTFPNSFKT